MRAHRAESREKDQRPNSNTQEESHPELWEPRRRSSPNGAGAGAHVVMVPGLGPWAQICSGPAQARPARAAAPGPQRSEDLLRPTAEKCPFSSGGKPAPACWESLHQRVDVPGFWGPPFPSSAPGTRYLSHVEGCAHAHPALPGQRRGHSWGPRARASGLLVPGDGGGTGTFSSLSVIRAAPLMLPMGDSVF